MKRFLYKALHFSAAAAVMAVMFTAFGQTLRPVTVSAQNCQGEYVEKDGRCVARSRNTCNTVPLRADDNCPFLKDYVVPAIKTLSAAVGIVVLIMVAWGGLQYTSSRDNPQQAAQAKNHVQNAIFALVIYIFMVAFLNWLVPGGVF